MEVGCLRHPGAFTIGSQLLDGTAQVKLVLLVVKLHLTAFNVDVYDCNCQNRTEDHLEEALRNVEEMSERIAEQDSTIQTLRKEVIMII